ncbi:MAG: amphi-Trp domain-containing protein [Deltaproteobacteria bacterium]|jgi:amphi-Trp domain-containing protein|nr:amphi-Trp domain-containing protein [Deltaproteobacteria bacterium]
MSKSRFHYNFVTDPQDVARYLQSLIQGFQNGELRLNDQNNQLILRPAEIIELGLDTSRRKGQVNLTISLSWVETTAHKQLSLPFDSLDNEPLPDHESKNEPKPGKEPEEAAPSPGEGGPDNAPV